LHRFAGVAEKLDLHLLEFTATERVVARIDFVAERLADLGNPERQLQSCAVENIAKVGENPLSSFGTQVSNRRSVLYCPDRRFEHEVEFSWSCQFPLTTRNRAGASPRLRGLVRS